MAPRPTDEQVLLRQSVREFAETEMAPHAIKWDEAHTFPLALLPRLGALGLMGIQIPERYGGAELGAVDYCICIDELARVDPAVALSVAAHNGLAAAHLYRSGSEAQRTPVCQRLRAAHLGAWALTEPQAGSDAGSLRTIAKRAGGGWRLTGTKTFTTHGNIADTLVVMAVTNEDRGVHGISAFLLTRPVVGLSAGRKENKLGMRASDTAELSLSDCLVGDEALIGEEGAGFLDAGRIGIAALAVGLAQGAFEAARGLTYRAAYLDDQLDGRLTTRESAMAKLFASETAVRVAEEGVQNQVCTHWQVLLYSL